MLRRSVSSAALFEFLAPRWASHPAFRHVSHAPSSGSCHGRRASSSTPSSRPPRPSAAALFSHRSPSGETWATSAASAPPGSRAALQRRSSRRPRGDPSDAAEVESFLRVLNKPRMTPAQLQSVNTALHVLRSGVLERDLAKAWQGWEALEMAGELGMLRGSDAQDLARVARREAGKLRGGEEAHVWQERYGRWAQWAAGTGDPARVQDWMVAELVPGGQLERVAEMWDTYAATAAQDRVEPEPEVDLAPSLSEALLEDTSSSPDGKVDDGMLSGDHDKIGRPADGRTRLSAQETDMFCIVIASFAARDHPALTPLLSLARKTPADIQTRRARTIFERHLSSRGREVVERAVDLARHAQLAQGVEQPRRLLNLLTKTFGQRDTEEARALFRTMISASEGGGQVGEPNWLSANDINDRVWSSFLSGAVHVQRLDFAEEVWKGLLARGVKPSAVIYNGLLDGYGKAGDLGAAESTWSRMLSEGVEPDLVTYTTMMLAYFRGKQTEKAEATFEEMKRDVRKREGAEAPGALLGTEKGRPAWNALIYGLCATGVAERATVAMEEMEKRYGLKPAIEAYNVLLRYHGRRADLTALAATVRAIKSAGAEPDVVTFTTVLSSLARAGKRDAVKKVLAIMDAMGVRANVFTYSAMVDALLKESPPRLAQAVELLGRMEADGVRANEVTFTSLIGGALRSDPADAAAAVAALVAAGSGPSSSSGDAYATADDDPTVTLALMLLSRMRSANIFPNRVTYHYLIKALLAHPSRSAPGLAGSLLREMRTERGIRANESTWFLLLEGLLKRRGDVEGARRVVEEMDRHGFVPLGGALRGLVELAKRGEVGARGRVAGRGNGRGR